MAAVLLSTSPASRPTCWTNPKSRSVATAAVFLGQATQIPPSAPIAPLAAGNLLVSRAREVTNSTTTSTGPRAARRSSTPPGSGSSSPGKSSGASSRATADPSLIPSLRCSGVPE
jgi:hypothetical protein